MFCFTPFHLFDQQVVTWWIASFSSACRVCFVCFFTVLPHLDNTNARHIYTTSLQSTREKNLVTYISQNTASRSLLNTYCRVLTSHFSITHCSQSTTDNSQFITHNSLLITNSFFTTNEDNVLCFTPFHLFDQQVHQHVTWWVASFSIACRVCFVSSFFCFAIFIQHPSNQRVKKKNTTLNSPFLLTTQYAQLINFYPPHNYPILVVHCSQLHIHCYLLATRTHNLLFIAYCSPFATFDLPITTHYSQRTKYNSPRITKNSQFIIHAAHNSQLTAHNVQLTTCNSLLTFFLIIKSLVIDYSLPSSRNSHFTIQNLLPITHFSLFDIH